MTLEALKQAIAELPAEEKTALATWLNEQEMDEDRQMQKDFSPGGRGMRVVEKVKADIRGGKSKRWINRTLLRPRRFPNFGTFPSSPGSARLRPYWPAFGGSTVQAGITIAIAP